MNTFHTWFWCFYNWLWISKMPLAMLKCYNSCGKLPLLLFITVVENRWSKTIIKPHDNVFGGSQLKCNLNATFVLQFFNKTFFWCFHESFCRWLFPKWLAEKSFWKFFRKTVEARESVVGEVMCLEFLFVSFFFSVSNTIK